MVAPVLALAGFMGSGKTSVGRALAESHGYEFVDLDDVVVADAGMSVERMFAERGEREFRQLELAALRRILRRDPTPSTLVLALGGGTPSTAEARELLASGCTTVWLCVDEQVAWERSQGTTRPLAQDRASFRALAKERRAVYASVADWAVDTAGLDIPRIASRLAALLPRPLPNTVTPAEWQAEVRGADCVSQIWGGPGRGRLLAQWSQELWAKGRRAVVLTDTNIVQCRRRELKQLAGLEAIGEHGVVVLPAGETSKTLDSARTCWDTLAKQRVHRDDVLVVVGGGVVGDLGGFVAATYLRGLPLWQIPTSVVAQVDSSVGGKVAVNLDYGKNLVGTFYQPQRVLVDPAYLITLPDAEVRNGLGEVLKYALLMGEGLLEHLESSAQALGRMDLDEWSEVSRRCVGYKAAVVQRDERDRGERAVLNLGHTTAHAIERCTGYGRVGHGFAVALGLLVALRVSEEVVECPRELRTRTTEVMERLGLPTRLELPPVRDLLEAMQWDKKVEAGTSGFVGLSALGSPVRGMDVPRSVLAAALEEVRV